MKKFISLLLAAMMLLSCTSAFAALEEVLPDQATDTGKKFVQDKKDDGSLENSASQQTDVWLQVTADGGKIDVTVPLVVLFKTNIDGGDATVGKEYKIVNNSTAAIKVTQVDIEDNQYKIDQNNNATDDFMKMVDKDEVKQGADATNPELYNKYSLEFLPTDSYVASSTSPAINKWTTAEDVSTWTDENTNDGKVIYTKKMADNATQGLWRIDPKNTDKSNESYIQMDIKTSPLNFVTKEGTDSEGIKYGVKLFTVKYTIAIDDSFATGESIKGTGVDGTATSGNAYEYK